MTNEELAFKVSRLVGDMEFGGTQDLSIKTSKAVVNMVLEEAAKIARSKIIKNPDSWRGDESFNEACEEIEEDIRKLSPKDYRETENDT
jgi:hypothetical protein